MNDETRQELRVSIAALGILAMVSMPLVGWGIWTWSNVNVLAGRVARLESDTRKLDNAVAGLIVEANSNSEHRIAHEREATDWKARIIANEEEVKRLDRRFERFE